MHTDYCTHKYFSSSPKLCMKKPDNQWVEYAYKFYSVVTSGFLICIPIEHQKNHSNNSLKTPAFCYWLTLLVLTDTSLVIGKHHRTGSRNNWFWGRWSLGISYLFNLSLLKIWTFKSHWELIIGAQEYVARDYLSWCQIRLYLTTLSSSGLKFPMIYFNEPHGHPDDWFVKTHNTHCHFN